MSDGDPPLTPPRRGESDGAVLDGDVVEQAVASFETAVASGRLAQAYLIVGNVAGQGVPFADAVLGRLFCPGVIKPCGRCSACSQLAARRHPDAVWIEPEKKSRIIDVDRIRQLQKLVYQTSLAGGWKAVVLVGADRINDSAANAFLKTLEEPPERCLFLLLTDTPQSILPTILSRCQRMVLSTESQALPEPWRTALLDIMSNPLTVGQVSRLSRAVALGALLDDIKKQAAAEEKGRADTDEVDEDTEKARLEARYRGLRNMVIRAMLLWYRDVLVLVCGAEGSALYHADRGEDVARVAAGVSYREALANVRAIENVQRQLERNISQDAVVYNAMSQLTV